MKKRCELLNKKVENLQSQKEKLVQMAINDSSFELLSREEYLSRKRIIEEEIQALEYEKIQLKDSEFKIEGFVDKCLHVISEPATSWSRYDLSSKVIFQFQIYPKGVTFDGDTFGTPEISPIFEVFQQFDKPKSRVVVPPGFEPGFLG